MSLLGMRVMSERVEIKEAELKTMEEELKRDIESELSKDSSEENECFSKRNDVGKEKVKPDNNNAPLPIVIDTIKKHKVYCGEEKKFQSLSAALQKFELDDW